MIIQKITIVEAVAIVDGMHLHQVLLFSCFRGIVVLYIYTLVLNPFMSLFPQMTKDKDRLSLEQEK